MSMEDKRSLDIMKAGIKKRAKHFRVQLPWKLQNPGFKNH